MEGEFLFYGRSAVLFYGSNVQWLLIWKVLMLIRSTELKDVQANTDHI